MRYLALFFLIFTTFNIGFAFAESCKQPFPEDFNAFSESLNILNERLPRMLNYNVELDSVEIVEDGNILLYTLKEMTMTKDELFSKEKLIDMTKKEMIPRILIDPFALHFIRCGLTIQARSYLLDGTHAFTVNINQDDLK